MEVANIFLEQVVVVEEVVANISWEQVEGWEVAS